MSHNNETKWFMQLNIIEFMKSLTKYREIDSLDIFYEKANEFLGNDNAPSDPVLPENPQEAYALGKMLYRLEADGALCGWPASRSSQSLLLELASMTFA